MTSTLSGRVLNGQPFLITAAIVQPPSNTYAGIVGEHGTPVTLVNGTVLSSGGATSTSSITQTSTVIDRKRVFSRDAGAETGTPGNFTTTYNKGWSTVPLALNPTAQSGVWAALYDADSNGATDTDVGTGTRLQAPVAIATSVNAGAQTLNVQIPAGPKFYYMDVALNPSMTNALRISTPFGVGHVTVVTGQSLAVGMFNCYEYNGATDLSGMTTYLPQNVVYAPKSTSYGGGVLDPDIPEPRPLGLGSWDPPKPTTIGGELYGSPFGPEYLSRITNRLGLVAAMIGFAGNGWPVENWMPTVSGLSIGPAWATLLPIVNHAGMKFDHFIWCQGDANAVLAKEEYRAMWDEFNRYLRLNTVKPFSMTASVGFRQIITTQTPLEYNYTDIPTQVGFGSYARIDAAIREGVTRFANSNWFSESHNPHQVYGHPTWANRIAAARGYYRKMMALRGQGGEGPYIASATRSGNIITATVVHDGGTALMTHTFDDDASENLRESNTAASADLASMFYVFPAGLDDAADLNGIYSNTLALDATTPIAITGPTTIQIKLASAPADNVALDLWYGTRAKPVYNNVSLICDNEIDSDGINYGRMLQCCTEAVYVPAPTPATATITITAINGQATNAKTPKDAVTVISGTFTGVAPNEVEVNLNGGAYVAGVWTKINHGGTWSTVIMSPTSNATYTVGVRETGTSIVSNTLSVIVADSDVPLSGVAFDFDLRKLNNFYKDTNRTLAATDGDHIKSYADPTGNGNHLTTYLDGPRLCFDLAHSIPGALYGHASTDARYSDVVVVTGAGQYYDATFDFISAHWPLLQTITGAPIVSQLRSGSFTILVVCRTDGDDGAGIPIVSAETSWVHGGNGVGQRLGVHAGNSLVFAERFCVYDPNTNSGVGAYVSDDDYGFPKNVNYSATRKFVVRFDVTTGTIKMMGDQGFFTHPEQSNTYVGDYTTGPAWDNVVIGSQITRFGVARSFSGQIMRAVIIPNHYATDSERDQLLAYADAVYGPGSSWAT